jgi:UDP-N-acetylglucosamine 2-epimerase (non-hydrolysing)
MNRQIIDCIADYLFAPTETSKNNIGDKLNKNQSVFVTGNTAIDALKTTVSDAYSNEDLDWVGENERLILVTAHRRENLGDPMRHIFTAIRRIVDENPDVKVIYPVHLNPKVQTVANEILGNNDRIKLIKPLDVLDFHNFMERAFFIMSDSGGVQEEAPSLHKPVLVLRDTTERPEGVEAGTLKLVGTDTDAIYEAANDLLNNPKAYEEMANAKNPYGDGFASKRIVDAIIDSFAKKEA